MLFSDLKQRCLEASDFDLHYAALVVFNELTTRRLGGKMATDASGNAIVVVTSPVRKSRVKTPKKLVGDVVDTAPKSPKQAAVNEMFGTARLQIGEELSGIHLGEEVFIASAPPIDSQESYQSISPEPSSDPRPIPSTTPAKKAGKAKSRE